MSDAEPDIEAVGPRDRFFRWVPWAGLLVGLTLTAYFWSDARDAQRDRRASQFARLIEQTADTIRDRLDDYRDAGHGGVGLFMASEYVTRDEWRRYVDSLELETRHPGVNGLGYAERVSYDDRARWIESCRRDGPPTCSIHPEPAEETREYFPIRYFESHRNGPSPVGLDLASAPVQRAAMERARDSGRQALSGAASF